jgi:hypothetical protein
VTRAGGDPSQGAADAAARRGRARRVLDRRERLVRRKRPGGPHALVDDALAAVGVGFDQQR